MALKKSKDEVTAQEALKKVEEAQAQVVQADKVEDAPVVTQNLSSDTLRQIAESSIGENNLDGIAIIAVKNGVYVPFVAAKTVSDVITMEYMFKREASKIIENVITNQK